MMGLAAACAVWAHTMRASDFQNLQFDSQNLQFDSRNLQKTGGRLSELTKKVSEFAKSFGAAESGAAIRGILSNFGANLEIIKKEHGATINGTQRHEDTKFFNSVRSETD